MSFCQPDPSILDTSRSRVILVKVSYGIGLPLGDLSDRFGQHFELSGGIGFLTAKNLHFSIDYDFLFGNKVKEDVLSSLRTIEGGIIGRNMQFASVFLRERGSKLSLNMGYFLGKKASGQRRGFLLDMGLGYLRHKVRIVDDFDSVVQIFPPALKGYDRQTSGFLLRQSLQYMYLSDNRMVNFYLGIDISEGFTKSDRAYNYSSQSFDTDNRVDILAAFRIGWIVPIYLSKAQRYY